MLRRRLIGVCAALLIASLAACDDGPTAPGVYSHATNGHVWTAVRVPASVPTLRTWLPYLRPASADAEGALRQVRALQGEADRVRRDGDGEAATQKEMEASLLAARSLTQLPPPYVLTMALAGLQQWGETAAAAGAEDLRAPAVEVNDRRAAAAAALERGDTLAAIAEIVTASAVAHSLAPAAVASRALAEAERTLAARSARDADAARATRLLRNAREALASGDDARAFRRALYALQLADAQTQRGEEGEARGRSGRAP